MSTERYRNLFNRELNRRKFIVHGAAAGAAVALGPTALTLAQDTIDTTNWTPETITAQAGTLEVDTAAECAKVVPLDYTGEVSYWYVGPVDADPQIVKDIDAQFWEAFAATYPNIKVNVTSLGYNDMLDQVRTAALGNAAPMVAKMPILWGVEFAAKGQLMELKPEDVGYPTTEFWPGAMKSVTAASTPATSPDGAPALSAPRRWACS